VLHQLHRLLVEYCIKYRLDVGLMMHHIHRRQCLHYISDNVQLLAVTVTIRPGLQFTSSELYRLPRLKTIFGERAFSHASHGGLYTSI